MRTQQEINNKYAEMLEKKSYLGLTDYMVIKSAETGYVVPADVLQERQAARDKINVLQEEIATLEEQLKQEQLNLNDYER